MAKERGGSALPATGAVPRCTGTMQVLATITDPAVMVAILTHLGVPTEPPAVPPQIPIWPGALHPPADLDAFDPA